MLEADTGDGGLTLAHAELPDLVLLDLGLPGMHGSSVLEALKEAPQTAKIPVIVVSAWGEGHALKMAFDRGAAGVLRKPFSTESLYELVDNALQSRVKA